MRIDVLTLLPDACDRMMAESIIGRARQLELLDMRFHQIRDYTENRQKQVDDYPYGGGMGMVMFAQPIADCFRAVCEDLGHRPHLIYLSPQGKTLTQQRARELAQLPDLCLLCGHYEGVDERIIEEIVDEEISIGDYVLTGGEIPACILEDCVARLTDGDLSDAACYENESHTNGLLEYPQVTRPVDYHGMCVPDVLLSGDHAKIDAWRTAAAIELTRRNRPDLLREDEESSSNPT